MEHTLSTCTVKTFTERYEKQKLNFDFTIQRDGGQWNSEQQSLLVHSILVGMIVPALYFIKEETDSGEVWTVIDGKQRLSTLMAFYNNEFKLSKDTDNITIGDKEYIIAGLKYKDLPEILQERFTMYPFDIVYLRGYTDEEIEEQFYRLNNGSIFTKQQKAVVQLGTELASKINEIEKHPFWERVNISKSQRKHGVVKETILKCLMLLSGYNYAHFGACEVVKFAKFFSKNYDDKQLEYFADILDKLNDNIVDTDDNNKILKPINIPAIVMNADFCDENDVSDIDYEKFITDWFETGCKSNEYLECCGSGSTHKAKVEGRVKVMNDFLLNFIGE